MLKRKDECNTIIVDRSQLSEHGEEIPALNPSSDGGHATGCNTAGPPPYGSTKGGTIVPSPYGGNTVSPSPGHAAHLAPNRRDACNSSDEGNIPGQQEENAWTPCDGCKGEVEKILHEKRRINEVISRIDPGQVRELQTLLELIGEGHHDGATSTLGQQELFPGSGVLISSFRLAALHQASKPNSMRLFHALFDHFFTLEECKNAVPFGRPGNNPSGRGKRVLDRKKVDGILTYVLRCGTLPGWDEIEEAKLKKAFVNKCRARANSKA
ncbi:hypothetical protein AALO_G00238500 [Alosa alosa]|uniref:BEN domain-containing protein n=1 Tax=Alosa alosa TaxID=278164 RepID=A0AAV6FW39_9TELE|nr:hypothetical protein AALO_G00238500 [Alosa alosa]